MDHTFVDVGMAVRRLQVRQHRALDAALRSLDVSFVQWDALRNLHLHPRASLRNLAALSYQSEQAFGTLAARMAARGLIERVEDTGRAVRHRLTERGDDILRRGETQVAQVIERSLAPLTPRQMATFEALLTKLLPPRDPTAFGG